MDLGILAARRAVAIEKIQEQSGIDLSRTALPAGARTTELIQLFQLEKLADEIGDFANTANGNGDEAFLVRIADIPGIGESTLEKIRLGLAEIAPE